MLQAIDGIGNKQVDHAWTAASVGDKSARFASAESMRWLAWARVAITNAMGLALIVFAAGIATARAARPRPVAFLVALTGLAYLAEGWVAGEDGFNSTHSVLIVASWVFSLAWMIWLMVVTRSATRQGSSAAGLAT